MKKLLNSLLVTTLICVPGFGYGMIEQQSDTKFPLNYPSLVAKITACCEPHEKNSLTKVSKKLNKLCSKRNQIAILHQMPLILGQQDLLEFMMHSSGKGDATIVANLLAAGADANKTDLVGRNPLHNAIDNNHIQVIELLISHGANVDTCEPEMSPLHKAVYQGDTKKVGLLLKAKAKPNAALKNGITPVHIAAYKGDVTSLWMLIAGGAQLHSKDESGNTPFKLAIQKGHNSIVALLLNKKDEDLFPDICWSFLIACQKGHFDIVQMLIPMVDVDSIITRDEKLSPIRLAAQNGHTDIVRLLITYNANVNVEDQQGVTPLFIAAQKGHTEIVRILIEAGAKIDKLFLGKVTPLWVASQNGHADIVQLLLKNKAKVNSVNQFGETALFMACHDGHISAVRALLTHVKQLLYIRNNKGVTPLMIACAKGYTKIVELLLDGGAKINDENNATSKLTSLCFACLNGHIDIVKLLLERNTAINIGDETPLFLASGAGHTDIVRLLLQHGANTNLTRNDGYSPLYMASQEGYIDIVQLLIAHKVKVNVVNNEDNKFTPLRVATINNHVEVIKLLLENGADINVMDEDMQTPLWIAVCKGQVEIVDLLLQYGADATIAKNGVKPIDVAKKNEIKLLLLPNAQECSICCDVKANILECIHCKQPLCKECAQNWIGVNFTFDTHYFEDPNWFNRWEKRNESCPYCRKKITQEELQQMISKAAQGKK